MRIGLCRRLTTTLGLLLVAALNGCRHRCPASTPDALHRAPTSFGRRLLVVAPHPDDEVLAAGGLIARTIQDGGDVHVIVATDGEAGVNRTHAPDLAAAREAETRRALGQAGLADTGVEFLGYADDGLERAWSERWYAARRDGRVTSSGTLVDALRAAIRVSRPDAIVLPLSLDEHPDHRAVGNFTLLAILGEAAGQRPRALGYVIHGQGRWPTCRPSGPRLSAIPPGCAGLLPWTGVALDPEQVAAKEGIIRRYRTQLGPTLLRYAQPTEAFATGMVLAANRAASPWRPALRRGARSIAITVPRTTCLVDAAVGDRLRLRYFRDGALEERVIELAPNPLVRGGAPGGELEAVDDVGVTLRPYDVDLLLDRASFDDIEGAVLEIVAAPGHGRGLSWLLWWA